MMKPSLIRLVTLLLLTLTLGAARADAASREELQQSAARSAQ